MCTNLCKCLIPTKENGKWPNSTEKFGPSMSGPFVLFYFFVVKGVKPQASLTHDRPELKLRSQLLNMSCLALGFWNRLVFGSLGETWLYHHFLASVYTALGVSMSFSLCKKYPNGEIGFVWLFGLGFETASYSIGQAVLEFIMFLECLKIAVIPLPQLPNCQYYRGKTPYLAIRRFFLFCFCFFFTSIFHLTGG